MPYSMKGSKKKKTVTKMPEMKISAQAKKDIGGFQEWARKKTGPSMTAGEAKRLAEQYLRMMSGAAVPQAEIDSLAKQLPLAR